MVHDLRGEVRDKHFLLELVKHAHLHNACQGSLSARHRWRLAGLTICKDAFVVLSGISQVRLTKILTAIRTSGICPYTDLRCTNGGNQRSQQLRLDVDAFWHFCYHHVAEPLADADEKARLEESVGSGARMMEYVAGRDGNPLAGASLDLHRNVDRRFMPPMTWAEVHQMYCLLGPTEISWEKGSVKLLQRVYKECWEAILGFRHVGQHARCTTCARLAKTRRDDPDLAERNHAHNEYKMHLQRVFAMRRVDMRFSRLSSMSCEPGCTLPNRCLHVRIDGLDQAKGRCPRNLENSKQWSVLWRPQLHIVGVVVEGLFEQYWVMDQDVRKDSAMECTVLSLAIAKARALLAEKVLRLPEFISIKYDNTTREGKNQIVAKWMSWIQHRGIARQVQDGSGEPGHSHDPLDQRFSVISANLSRCKVLQTPEDFVNTIRKTVHHVRGRKVFADILPGTWDWKGFFDSLGLKASGIGASAAHPDVCFSKRFLQLRDLPKLSLPGWELEVPAMYLDLPRHPEDVVMVCKQFWASDRLAQPPLLWIPHSYFARLGRFPTTPAERNTLSERQIKEYKKTAAEVVKKPWCLFRAGDYLEKWVANNTAGTYGRPPDIPFLLAEDSEPVWSEEMAVEWRDYAPAPPVRIAVEPDRKKARHMEPIIVVPAPVHVSLPPDVGDELVDAARPLAPAAPASPAAPARSAAAPAVPAAPGVPAATRGALVAKRPACAAPVAPAAGRPARARAAPKAMGMKLGCSKCRWAGVGCCVPE